MRVISDGIGATPNGFTPEVFTLTPTADGEGLSVLWVGTYGQLQVTKVYHLQADQLHFTVSVTIKNIGSEVMTNLFCKCVCSSVNDVVSKTFDKILLCLMLFLLSCYLYRYTYG